MRSVLDPSPIGLLERVVTPPSASLVMDRFRQLSEAAGSSLTGPWSSAAGEGSVAADDVPEEDEAGASSFDDTLETPAVETATEPEAL